MASAIFHDGDLQSGISLAIQQNKVVACLVRKDDDHWSQIWEEQWLSSEAVAADHMMDDAPPLGLLLSEKAVLLRIEEGSQEAEFLNAFCKVEAVPTLVVIQNGQVLEKLEGGVDQNEFKDRLLKSCDVGSSNAGANTGTAPPQPEVFTVGEDSAEPSMIEEEQTPSSSSTAQTLLQERAQRIETQRAQREAAEKAQRTARANARRQEEAEASSSSSKQRTTSQENEKQLARDAWIYQQKQRKDEAKKERERILSQIENDKQERKVQAQRQKEAQSAAGAGAEGAYSSLNTNTSSATSSSVPTAKMTTPTAGPRNTCALQIRLFDGSSIKGKFAADTDIATAVRTWVNEASPEGGADIPYTFRQILAPKPSRSIEVSEEHQSLAELGLVPNATLVLVPVAGYQEAYAKGGGAAGYFGWAWNVAYSPFRILGSALSYFPGVGRLYMGGTGDEHEQSNVDSARMAGADSAYQSKAVPGDAAASAANASASGYMKVNTLFDQREEEKQRQDRPAEFYNGNSSAFEGRKDDDEGGKR